MNAMIKPALEALKERLSELYGDRLRGLYVFGSFARDEEDEESDIDILIVLDRIENYAHEIVRTSEIIAQISLDCGRSISCVYASEEQWGQDQGMFFLNLREEAIPA
jgi:predicted nucleotidyltransferase